MYPNKFDAYSLQQKSSDAKYRPVVIESVHVAQILQNGQDRPHNAPTGWKRLVCGANEDWERYYKSGWMEDVGKRYKRNG